MDSKEALSKYIDRLSAMDELRATEKELHDIIIDAINKDGEISIPGVTASVEKSIQYLLPSEQLPVIDVGKHEATLCDGREVDLAETEVRRLVLKF